MQTNQTEESPKCVIVESACDYWRFTLPVESPAFPAFEDAWQCRVIENLEHDEACLDYNNHGWKMRGAGGVCLGVKDNAAIFQASGQAADALIFRTRELVFDGKTTRCDVQATLYYPQGGAKTAAAVREEIREREAQAQAPRRRSLRLMESAQDADTCYVGARSSAAFGRYYNAHAQHPGRYPRGSWRWEWQNNERAAQFPADTIRRAEHAGAACLSLLCGRLIQAGFRESWFGQHPPLKPPPTFHKSTKEGKLKWARNAWPAVIRAAMEGGWLDELSEAAGVEPMRVLPFEQWRK